MNKKTLSFRLISGLFFVSGFYIAFQEFSSMQLISIFIDADWNNFTDADEKIF